MFRQLLDDLQGVVCGAVIHKDKFRGISLQVLLENPVHLLFERRNGLFLIQAGNDQGNSFHGSARIIRQRLSGCQKIVPCTQSSLPSARAGGKAAEKGVARGKTEGSELRQVAYVILVFRGVRVFQVTVTVLSEGPEIVIRIHAVPHFQVLCAGGFGGNGLLAAQAVAVG